MDDFDLNQMSDFDYGKWTRRSRKRTRANRQAKYTLLDVTLSLADRCENYPHKLGDGTFDDPSAWLFVRTAEIVRKAGRNQYMIRERVAELLENE